MKRWKAGGQVVKEEKQWQVKKEERPEAKGGRRAGEGSKGLRVAG